MIQTVPSLALLALMMVLLGGLIGFWPAFLALLLYSILPILSNTLAGLRGVDPALTEATRGLGMSDRQMLWQVELPLAAPVILGGIRTATVLAVGTATLATPVGGESLGNYIFAGFATLNHTSTLFGCVAAALLAVVLDQLVRLLEVAARRLACTASGTLLLLVVAGMYEPVSRWLGGSNRGVVASAAFNEQYTLSHAMSEKLEAAGFRPERRQGMGYGVQHLALQRGEVDCMVAWFAKSFPPPSRFCASGEPSAKVVNRVENGAACAASDPDAGDVAVLRQLPQVAGRDAQGLGRIARPKG